jgi:hypothetical protein
MRARRTAATTTALFATLALAGCEQPTPPVTFYSSGTAVDTRASFWCFELPPTPESCREDQLAAPQLPVRDGQLAVNVTSEIAERGWYVSAGGQQAQPPVFEEYFVFRGLGQLPEEGFPLELVVTDGEGGSGEVTGRYLLEIVPQ